MNKGDKVFINGKGGIVTQALANGMVEARLLGGGNVCVDAADCLLATYDWRKVYPAGSALPEGASGWTLCRWYAGGSYSVEIADCDRERATADRVAIEAKIKSIRTKAEMARELQALDLLESDRLSDSKITLQNALYERAWPLLEVRKAA